MTYCASASISSRGSRNLGALSRFFFSCIRSVEKLLASCERMDLEGIVSKRRDFPYRSGQADWIKVKCLNWREANKDRWELFNKHNTSKR